MFARQGMSQSTRTPTHSQVRAVCTQRETTGRVIIVNVAEREDKREESRERDKRREEERRGEEEKRREQEKQRRRKTPPCVDSKRLRVCVQDASVCTGKTPACVGHAGVFTRRRLERTHGGVLIYTRRSFPHAKPHHTSQNNTTPHHTTTHHTMHNRQPTVILRRMLGYVHRRTADHDPVFVQNLQYL